ncbi:MAG: RNA methyltransferase [candidate division KSB1 bacterium]|nr:RNA methyltransferase [candidate division KSB1 bacterium]MDZ7274909.1 RNA methyltransferase [candidate division KSB1 bacterium]MDZ7286639.1 RNA methyltransferase [candidate division KSB1 bacterium]MDZ7299198.1 RNA methyltransferase [candidate division KSB1 bacterium]MDZ7350062.1 RNA methyltransferase [candidate division KSB1 bacterium]
MLSKADLKSISRLLQKKYREETNCFLVEGGRLCEEAIQSGWEIEHIIYCPSLLNSLRSHQALKLALQRGLPVEEVNVETFANLSDTKNSQGIVAVVRKRPPARDPLEQMKQVPRCLWVAIEKLHDPGNLGTILRTADWLGVDGIIVGSTCVEVYNPKVVRASMGALFRLAIHEVEDVVGLLRKFQMFGCVLYGADQSGDFPYTTLRFSARKVLVLGDEIEGLSPQIKEIIQHRVSIPKRGGGDSLNVAIAAAILLAEMCR